MAFARRTMHAMRIRRELASLDPRELDDLGIGRADIGAIAAADARRVIPD